LVCVKYLWLHMATQPAYQPYDDTWFWPRYDTLWREKQYADKHALVNSSFAATSNMEELHKTVEALLNGLHRENINDKEEAKLLVNAHLSDSIMIAFLQVTYSMASQQHRSCNCCVLSCKALRELLSWVTQLVLRLSLEICIGMVMVLYRIIPKQWNGTINVERLKQMFKKKITTRRILKMFKK
jgi:hypothetical protein